MSSRCTLALLALLAAGCAEPDPPASAPSPGEPSRVRTLVDAALEAHGGDVMRHAELAFVFRGTPYVLRRDGGRFRYTRTVPDSLGRTVDDRVGNDGVRRFVDGVEVALSPAEARRVETTVNSVAYFALLPLPLADPAVRLRDLGPDTLRGRPYDRVEVTFVPEGGGRDWQDRYVYWLHPEAHTVDYLAYSYELDPTETGPNATGSRFREATGARTVEGVRVQDYRNYTAFVERLEDYAAAFEADTLRLVSEVVLDSVRVTPLAR